MEPLSVKLTLNDETIRSPNLCDKFTEEDLSALGSHCKEQYERDLESREPWRRRSQAGLNLAMQLQESKAFPWQGAANVKFPLITIAAMQFHARAYPTVVNGRDVVRCQITGGDPDGSQSARAKRIGTHMSWQLLVQNKSWEEEQDRTLLVLPIVGTVFKKSYNSAHDGYNTSELVMPQNLVFDYWAKSVEDCATKTHIIPMHRNRIHENVRRGRYMDCTECSWFLADAAIQQSAEQAEEARRQGKGTPQSTENTPFTMLEQHTLLDLDQDGYAEPYIVTFEAESCYVVRIVSGALRIEDVEYNDDNEVIQVSRWECFTKYSFIPSPDGGVLDIGFGTLLGPLNESVDSVINQLLDAGTMSNTAGGFLGRGAKIRGGQIEFNPFGWTRVDSTGDDLRKNIFPLPVRDPSAVLFNLLNLLIDYTQRISGSVDLLTGVTPGQNTPAETSRTAAEQGLAVYSAIYKRVWRSMKWEFDKLFKLNSIFLPTKLAFGEGDAYALREDYALGGASVIPVADPTLSSRSAQFQMATMVKAAAQAGGGYDQVAVEEYWLNSLGVEEKEKLFPGPNSPKATPPPSDPKIELQKMKNALEFARMQQEQQQFILTLQENKVLNQAKIMELQASSFKLAQEGKGVEQQHIINAFNAATMAMHQQNNAIDQQINRLMQDMKHEREARVDNGAQGFLPGMAGNGGNQGVPLLPGPPAPELEGSMGG